MLHFEGIHFHALPPEFAVPGGPPIVEAGMNPGSPAAIRSWTAKQIALDRGLDPVVTDDLKYAIERHLYHYGRQFRYGYEGGMGQTRSPQEALAILERIVPEIFRIESDPRWIERAVEPYRGKRILFNNTYINRGIGTANHQRIYGDFLERAGWTQVPPPWSDPSSPNEEWLRLREILALFESTQDAAFELLVHPEYQGILARIEAILESLYATAPLQGLIAPYAETLFERASLRLFNKLGKVSMVAMHSALPGVISPEMLGPARHIVVWGDAAADSFAASGVDRARIVVSGHPLLDKLPRPVPQPDFADCLVLSRSQFGAPIGDHPIHQNRGELVQYLDEVERVLKRLGVRKARLRPHPSESPAWYREFADARFYTIDEEPLDASLARAGVVIGATTSVLLDAHVAGKPYVVYEPREMVHGDDLGTPLVPPFDGSVPGVPFADSVDGLERLLRNPLPSDNSFWKGFLAVPPRPEAILAALEQGPARATPVADTPEAALRRAESRVAAPVVPRDQAIVDAVRPYTMTPPARIQTLIRLVDHISAEDIPGDMVECGVWKGGSIMSAAIRLLDNRCSTRDIYLYDTFEGMSEPTENDVSPEGKRAAELLRANPKDKANHIWAYSPLEDVKRHMDSTGYPSMRVRYVQGKVEDTIPGILPGRIALLRLDTDWYESTLHELEHLYPLLVPGGVLVLDDYGFWQGARKAVDEYFAKLPHPPELHIIHDGVDDSARWCVKP